MSKSKGEFLTVSLLEEKGYNPLVYRMFCLQSHYRKPLLFSYDVMDNVKTAYDKLIKRISALGKEGEKEEEKIALYQDKFAEAMGNDMNTSQALTVLYDVLKADMNDASKRFLIADFDSVLSLGLLDEIQHLCEEEQLSPSEYYDMVNAAKKDRRKRAMGSININKEDSEW